MAQPLLMSNDIVSQGEIRGVGSEQRSSCSKWCLRFHSNSFGKAFAIVMVLEAMTCYDTESCRGMQQLERYPGRSQQPTFLVSLLR